ncbi:MAG: 2-oxoglutarate dehydrogenase E1 component [Gammaproteobacteria bacterium]|nr:2-oxoglutarate dehydrogenase E1 component [Gammaproteobacteria bacterium]
MQALWQDSYLAPENDTYLENLYETYLSDPEAVTPSWRQYFDRLLKDNPRTIADVSHAAVIEEMKRYAEQSARSALPAEMTTRSDKDQFRVLELIAAFRRSGHMHAQIDPLELMTRASDPTLTLEYYGFTEADLNKTFNAESFASLQKSQATLGEIYQKLQEVYCGHIGFEYMHINRIAEVEWIRNRIEKDWANLSITPDEKKHLLDRLAVADALEKYLGSKYVGQKRFSLEGGDALVPLLDKIITQSVVTGAKETVIGMAHRGRLNVLVNIVGKDPTSIFNVFEGGIDVTSNNSGDVKYHLGFSSNVDTPAGQIHVALAFNPSHLEIVSPVVQGSVRARQRRRSDKDQRQVYPIQIHGDAAFSSQGVVMETFSMSQARWFTVGGSVHIVINNQIGFTISNPKDSRSTTYCTDSAKMVEAPILHVNGNDAEAVYFAALFAIDYRQTFKRDIVIDLVCYRRHGHNEADEPSATQPIMYKKIKALPPPYQIYAKKLIAEGVVTEEIVTQWINQYRQALDDGQPVIKVSNGGKTHSAYQYMVNWDPYVGQPWTDKISTALPMTKLKALGEKLITLPDGFVAQTQVKKMLDTERKMLNGEMPLNWGYAENLAYASLLTEGYPIRLCGQDSARGTFAHRHAVLHDQNTDAVYIPLTHLAKDQAQINIVDSLLSEEAVLAFEYGYATAEPNYLVIWEAQFGDFANGAQVVIDQFISSGEQKWGRLCGLVMLLPHGYEGQGPEHSSARLERYLQLCAQDNMQVCIPTTPAQIFHLLRRQMIRPYRKPLIVMSPKTLLRHPSATSTLQDLAEGEFQTVIPEIDQLDAKQVERVVLCTGKIYYELLEARRALQVENIAIIRLEQLYPFPQKLCEAVLKPYHHVHDVVWCQEEPQNQGAWTTMIPYLQALLGQDQKLQYIGRNAAASPAVGYHAVHEKEQKLLVATALTIRKKQ